MNALSTTTVIVPLILFTAGIFVCGFSGHLEFAGLGLMICATILRGVWGREDRDD